MPVFAHFLIRSRKTGRPADLLAEATPIGALLSSQFLQAAPGRLGRRQRSGGGASAPSGMLLFLVALHVAPLERFEGCRGVVSLLVETIFSEQGYDEP